MRGRGHTRRITGILKLVVIRLAPPLLRSLDVTWLDVALRLVNSLDSVGIDHGCGELQTSAVKSGP